MSILNHRYTRLIDSFEAENGIKVEETGEQKVIGEEAGTVSKGSFSYPENGAIITVNWVADENGFQATGDHLPTPPPVPDHVVKLLADLAAAGLLWIVQCFWRCDC